MKRPRKDLFALAGAAVAVACSLPSPSLAQAAPGRRPWLGVVHHRIDIYRLDQDRVGFEPPDARRPGQPQQVVKVQNVTAGVVTDRAGHVVTRLVNYDPKFPPEEVTIGAPNGRMVAARLVGMDYPTGFVVLQVPE